MKPIGTILRADTSSNAAVQRFLLKVAELQRSPNTPTVKIALLGDAGLGKSSLINSMLDTPDVAKEGCAGEPCTCFATEYRRSLPGQIKKFGAKAERLNDQQIKDLLEDGLAEYVNYNFQKSRDWTVKETKEFYSQADAAQETFRALFCTKPGFDTPQAIKTSIGRAYHNEDLPRLLLQFGHWCKELLDTNSIISREELIEADTAFGLATSLRPILSSNSACISKTSLWPLVGKVSIGIRGPRVLNNIVFVDLPGISDINPVRVKASQESLKACDALWIVTEIKRCIRDDPVDEIIQNFGERFSGRLAIICTKTDITGDQDKLARDYEAYATRFPKYNKQVVEAKKNLTYAKHHCYAQTVINELEETLQRRLDRKLSYIVNVRNEGVKKALYDVVSERLQTSDMDIIHCVSNKHYSQLKGCIDEGDQNCAQLGPLATGIPQLRKFALRLPSRNIWDALSAHIQLTSSAVIQVLQIWANTTDASPGTGLMDGRVRHQQAISSVLQDYRDLVAAKAKEYLINPFEDLQDIVDHAQQYLDSVEHWHYSTIRAFIRRKGTYETKIAGSHSWNAEMVKSAVEVVNLEWQTLISDLNAGFETAKENILQKLEDIPDELSDAMQVLSLSQRQLRLYIEVQRNQVQYAFAIGRDSIDKSLRNIKHAATNDANDGYFAQAMNPAYSDAELIKGNQARTNSLGILRTHINASDEDSPFMIMARSTEHAISFEIYRHTQTLQKACNRILDEIYTYLGSLVGDDTDDKAAVLPIKIQLQRYLPSAVTELQSIDEDLEKIQVRSHG